MNRQKNHRHSVRSNTENNQATSTNRSAVNSIDPNFEEQAGLHPELVTDWLSILIKENRERIENVNDTFRIFVHSKSVQYFFTICLRLRLPQDVKYIAIGIFNDFMIEHICGLYTMISCLPDRSNEEKIKEWDKIESTISRQLTLRVISCIQIASKIHSYNDSLCTKSVRRCLQSLGLSYTEEAVKKSEVRVLNTVGFCVNTRQTPVAYIESVLEILIIRKKDDRMNVRNLWEYSILILDCVFLRMEEVYLRLLVMIHGQEARHLGRDRIIRLQSDYLLLSAGVILSSCLCVHGSDFAGEIVPLLGQICSLPVEDARTFPLLL
uniref:Cyclin N-terminal domain-containing protein 1 n=1 Tax=Ditylenchus dipsaci TaxID=166011 RepID=A0A915E362_9BILA